MARKRTKYFVDFPCPQCGTMVTPQERRRTSGKFNGLWMPQKFCSTGCANKARPRKIWLDKHGYPQMSIGGGKSVGIHRLVMERKLGRKLLPGETVHHRDGNRQNYDETNLELWTGRHGRGQRASDLHPICASEHIAGALSLGG